MEDIVRKRTQLTGNSRRLRKAPIEATVLPVSLSYGRQYGDTLGIAIVDASTSSEAENDPRPPSTQTEVAAAVIEEAEILHASLKAGTVAPVVVATMAVVGMIYLLKIVLVTRFPPRCWPSLWSRSSAV